MALEDTLERIAVALEKLAGNAPMPDKPAKPKAPAKSKAAKEPDPEPEQEEDPLADDEPELDKTAVRTKLAAYQEAFSTDDAKALLKKFDAASIGKLDPSNYAGIVEAVDGAIEAGEPVEID